MHYTMNVLFYDFSDDFFFIIYFGFFISSFNL